MVEGATHAASESMRAAFKTQVRKWKGIGIESLRKILAEVAGESADRTQFIEVAKKFGLAADVVDADYQGKINSTEFVDSLRPPLSDRCQALMEKLWSVLSPNGADSVSPSAIAEHYDSRGFNEGSPYNGRFSDPNHAGGIRVISMLDEMEGDKRLCRCEGIGGEGEPASFILPAWINPDDSIVIDFSAPPKNGPKDLHATFDTEGGKGIKFSADGNKWIWIPATREENFQSLMGHFNLIDSSSPTLVTKATLMYHYRDFYASVSNDNHFCKAVGSIFKVKEDSASQEITTAPASNLPKLIYFGLGARAEGIRALLSHARFQYEDVRVSGQTFKKDEAPLGSLPVWEEDGFKMCQSTSILRMLGIRLGYYTEDPMIAYKIDSIMDFAEGLNGKFFGMLFRRAMKNEEITTQSGQEWCENFWDVFIPVLEQRLVEHGKPFIAGTDRPTVADFKAFQPVIGGTTINPGSQIPADVAQMLEQKMKASPNYWRWVQKMKVELADYLSTRKSSSF